MTYAEMKKVVLEKIPKRESLQKQTLNIEVTENDVSNTSEAISEFLSAKAQSTSAGCTAARTKAMKF